MVFWGVLATAFLALLVVALWACRRLAAPRLVMGATVFLWVVEVAGLVFVLYAEAGEWRIVGAVTGVALLGLLLAIWVGGMSLVAQRLRPLKEGREENDKSCRSCGRLP